MNTKMSITDGVMRLSSDPYCNGIASHSKLKFSNFVLQVDVSVQDAESFHVILFWHTGDKPEFWSTFFKLWGFGDWVLISQQDYALPHQSGVSRLDFLKPITITIISKDTTYSIYLNSIPLTFFNDIKRDHGSDINLVVYGVNPDLPVTVDFDNLKVWDLDKIENLN